MQSTQQTDTWMTRAWHTPFAQETLTVADCAINTLRWGDPSNPGVLLVHGGLAHAQWWRHIAPAAAQDHYVVALDLSGHGDSGHRTHYGTHWVEEIMAVREAAGFSAPPALIGHSMGGLLSVGAAAFYPEAWRAAMIIDSPITGFSDKNDQSDSPRGGPRRRQYPSLEKARQRFRLLPHQPCTNPELMQLIAESSLKQEGETWTWKFDPNVFETSDRRATAPLLKEIGCPWWLVRGENSRVVGAKVADDLRDLGITTPFITIPEAHHHLMLDQPLALISVIRAFLAVVNQ